LCEHGQYILLSLKLYSLFTPEVSRLVAGNNIRLEPVSDSGKWPDIPQTGT